MAPRRRSQSPRFSSDDWDSSINKTLSKDTYAEAKREMGIFHSKVPDPWEKPRPVSKDEADCYGEPPEPDRHAVYYADIDFQYFERKDMEKQRKEVVYQPTVSTAQENELDDLDKIFYQFIEPTAYSTAEDDQDVTTAASAGAHASANQNEAPTQILGHDSQGGMDIGGDGTLKPPGHIIEDKQGSTGRTEGNTLISRANGNMTAQAEDRLNEQATAAGIAMGMASAHAKLGTENIGHETPVLVAGNEPDRSPNANRATAARITRPHPQERPYIEFGTTLATSSTMRDPPGL